MEANNYDSGLKYLHIIMNKSLNSVNKSTREALSSIFKDPLFTPIYDVSIRNLKELALQKIKESNFD